MIFPRGKLKTPHLFHFGEETIDLLNEYNYLGRPIVFNYNAKLDVTKQNLYQIGIRAVLFALLKKQ